MRKCGYIYIVRMIIYTNNTCMLIMYIEIYNSLCTNIILLHVHVRLPFSTMRMHRWKQHEL